MTADESPRPGSPALQERGLFWWANDPVPTTQFAPDTSVFGELKIEAEGRITLDLDGMISDRSKSLPALASSIDEPELKTRMIQGLLKDSSKRVLLCDLSRRVGHFASSNMLTEGFLAAYCLVGEQDFPRNLKELHYSYVDIDLKGFEEWLRLSSIQTKRSKISLHTRYRRPKNMEYSLPNGRLSVIYDLLGPWIGETRRDQINLRESVLLRLKPTKRMSFNDVTNYHDMLQDLFILMTESNHYLGWPRVALGSKTRYTLYYARIMSKDDAPRYFDCVVNFIQVRDRFGELLSNWWEKREKFGPGFGLYLGTRRGMQLYEEHRFIMLIWGIEAYHREKYGSARTESVQKKVAQILEKITSPKDKRWLEGRLRFASEPNLEQRIFETIRGVPLDLDSKRVRRFARGCAKDRNDMSHFGEHRDEDRTYTDFILSAPKERSAFSSLSSIDPERDWRRPHYSPDLVRSGI